MFAEKLKKMLESGELDEYFEEQNRKYEILEGRFKKFEKYLETTDFDTLIYRLVLEHGDEYREKCYINGVEPYPNNKLEFLFKYVMSKCEHIEVPELKNDFMHDISEFKDYYFEVTYGQGCIHAIYNKKDLQIVLQV
ncbi:MAG: hypothetical protein ACOC22_02280 [bacterium]